MTVEPAAAEFAGVDRLFVGKDVVVIRYTLGVDGDEAESFPLSMVEFASINIPVRVSHDSYTIVPLR